MRRFGQHSGESVNSWLVSTSDAGIRLSREGEEQGWRCASEELGGFVAQLTDDSLAKTSAAGCRISWHAFYKALDSGHYPGLTDALGMPSVTRGSPVLESRGSLSDPDFAISVRGWSVAGERIANPERVGGILVRGTDKELMSARHWEMCEAIDKFSDRDATGRSQHGNQLAWARIRELADRADAKLDDFLTRSVVIAPDTLKLHLRRAPRSG